MAMIPSDHMTGFDFDKSIDSDALRAQHRPDAHPAHLRVCAEKRTLVMSSDVKRELRSTKRMHLLYFCARKFADHILRVHACFSFVRLLCKSDHNQAIAGASSNLWSATRTIQIMTSVMLVSLFGCQTACDPLLLQGATQPVVVRLSLQGSTMEDDGDRAPAAANHDADPAQTFIAATKQAKTDFKILRRHTVSNVEAVFMQQFLNTPLLCAQSLFLSPVRISAIARNISRSPSESPHPSLVA